MGSIVLFVLRLRCVTDFLESRGFAYNGPLGEGVIMSRACVVVETLLCFCVVAAVSMLKSMGTTCPGFSKLFGSFSL